MVIIEVLQLSKKWPDLEDSTGQACKHLQAAHCKLQEPVSNRRL